MEQQTIRRRIIDPESRIVTLTDEAWEHITQGHQELARCEHLVAQTISHPDDIQPDVRPDRQRYYIQGEGPTEYFCVVVEYTRDGGDVITAFGHREPR